MSRHLEHAWRKRKGITLKPCVDSNWRRVCTQAPEGSEPRRDSEEGAEMAGALKQAATGVVGAAKKATEVQQKGALAAAARAYHERVVDHYENPRNVGSFDKQDDSVGTGLVGAPACGDVMKLQIQVDDDGNIEDARFKTFGCGSAIASSSVATEWIKGRNVNDAASIRNSDIAKHLSLPPVKLHCSMLAEDAIQSAVKDIKDKRGHSKDASEDHSSSQEASEKEAAATAV